LSKAVKIKLKLKYIYTYTTTVKPVVVHGSGTWAMAEMDMTRMSTWERKIHGTVVEQGIGRKRSNQESGELYKHLDIVPDIKRKDWNGLDI
jgi:hypothetical protein